MGLLIRMNFMFHFLLALVAITLGSTENTTTIGAGNLPTPSIYGISNFHDEGPTIHWLINKGSLDTSAVLGYKFKLWEVGCVEKPKYKIVNGERVLYKNGMPELRDYSTLRNFSEFTLEGVNNTNLLLTAPGDIRPDLPYHVLVAAFGAAGEGPVSSPFRFQYVGRFTCRRI